MWYLITLIAPILWGTSYVFMESGLDNGLPLWNAFFRALPAGILLLLVRPIKWEWYNIRYGAAMGALNIGVFFVCMFIATYRLPGSLVATLGATLPIQVMLLRWVLFHERPQFWQVLAGGLGLYGVYILLSGAPATLDTVGIVIAFTGIFSMSLATVLMQHHGMTNNVVGFMGTQLIAGALCILPFALFMEGALPRYETSEVLTLGWLSIVNTALGYLIWLYGIRKIGVFNASLLTLVNPVVAVILGVLYMQDQISAVQYLAIVLILFSVALPNLSQCIKRCFGRWLKREQPSLNA